MHSTFSDMPLVAETFNLQGKLSREGKELPGKVDGMRGLEVTVEYVSAFADFVLAKRYGTLLRSDGNERFTELKVNRYV